MNKNDVLKISEAVAAEPYFKDFVVRRSDSSIICKTAYGYKKIEFEHYNTFDLVRNDLALEMKPIYGVRFNVLHKWFEKYTKMPLKYHRNAFSIAFDGSQLNEKEDFYFLENRVDYAKDLHQLCSEIVRISNRVFTEFTTLTDFYNYWVSDVLSGQRELPDEGFEWVPSILIATKIVVPERYGMVKKMVLQRIEYMKGRNNVNLERYYDDLPVILEDLENTDFSSGKWGAIPPK